VGGVGGGGVPLYLDRPLVIVCACVRACLCGVLEWCHANITVEMILSTALVSLLGHLHKAEAGFGSTGSEVAPHVLLGHECPPACMFSIMPERVTGRPLL
jgi:hypothetical protein